MANGILAPPTILNYHCQDSWRTCVHNRPPRSDLSSEIMSYVNLRRARLYWGLRAACCIPCGSLTLGRYPHGFGDDLICTRGAYVYSPLIMKCQVLARRSFEPPENTYPRRSGCGANAGRRTLMTLSGLVKTYQRISNCSKISRGNITLASNPRS